MMDKDWIWYLITQKFPHSSWCELETENGKECYCGASNHRRKLYLRFLNKFAKKEKILMPLNIVTKRKQFPDKKHYAILQFSSEYIQGDERSKKNPGHGYPAYTLEYVNYYYYDEKEEWLTEIKKLATGEDDWVAFEAGKPVKIRREVSVDIED